MVLHHQPEDGELFVGLDGWEYEWRDGGLVRIGQGFEVDVSDIAGDDVGLEITVTDLEMQAIAGHPGGHLTIIDDPPTEGAT